MASLPESLVDREVFVLDPMLATGGSLVHCCELLTARGTTSITVLCALAAPDGIRRLEESGLPLRVFTASIDEGLNDKRSEEHTSELQSRQYLVCRLLLEKKTNKI